MWVRTCPSHAFPFESGGLAVYLYQWREYWHCHGIHWPLLDEELSIDGLLGISHYPAVTKGKAAWW
jgi:hypothetical protein